ncbi:hypothetical protein [Allorhodopirellula solitaria]|uniref:Uncharacterized protein n=1 Tax=Allorhodopirellula solitaria TaxID=2527987 RepID=A0A5C5XA41_9BACT|nr:hypothetical protein [Allorhodopirellula solitaria]TWT59271.1 hypothetical protein CA85_39670 [Allorhodopirellula solitaria]
MKIDSYHRRPLPWLNSCRVAPTNSRREAASIMPPASVIWVGLALAITLGSLPRLAIAQSPTEPAQQPTAPTQQPAAENPESVKTIAPARRLLARVIEQIALGPAFDAKIRQRVRVGDREVIGVGTYEQAGDGSGWFNLQVAMHDGDGKHTLQQISDGRLAWTREQIGEEVTLQRVDVGRLDQWVQGAVAPVYRQTDATDAPIASHLPPSVRVGAWTEMLERIASDHDLTLASGRLEQRDVWIVRGKLKPAVRAQRLTEFGSEAWPELYPTEVVVAVAKSASPETGFGRGLPLRLEFYADPVVTPPAPPTSPTAADTAAKDTAAAAESATTPPSAVDQSAPATPTVRSDPTQLISLIELYSIRPISTPPIGRFRFENQDMEVNFTNDTDRYLSRYGIHITERQSRMLRR